MQSTDQASWATVALETFEFNMVPWAGRRYAEWLRAWSRPHPGDPRGLRQVPAQMYALFQKRVLGERLTREQAEELGHPGVPGERDLRRSHLCRRGERPWLERLRRGRRAGRYGAPGQSSNRSSRALSAAQAPR